MKSLGTRGWAGVTVPPGLRAHPTVALPPVIPLWLSRAVPCIDTTTAPLASPMTLPDGCGSWTCRCGGATSRPFTDRICVDWMPKGLVHVMEMDRGPNGMGSRVRVVWK